MGVKTYAREFESSVSANRIFKAFCLDSHNCLPKVLPSFQSVEFVQGDCVAPGSVKLIKYVTDQGESKWAKHKIDEVDEEKFYYKYTVIEGIALDDKIESIVVEVKVEAKSTGCAINIITHFHTKGDVELDEAKLMFAKDKVTKSFKAVDEYLQANPDVYA